MLLASASRAGERCYWPRRGKLHVLLSALSLRWTFPSDGWFFDDAWQALAARAPIRMLPTVGQTQPGYTAMLLAWSRVTGGSIGGLIAPALVAGTIGPPLLYLWLRRLRFDHGTSAVLAAALVITPIHIRFSGRIKVYAVGLAVAAVRGPNPVSARFLVLGPVLAAAGSTLGRIPFGPPDGDLRRVSLWLFPAVAFGVASSVSALWSQLPSLRARQARDVALVALAVAVVLGLGHREPYWDTGAKRASEQVASQLRDHEVVVVTRLTAYSFSLHSGLPVHLRATPSRLVGFVPVIEDPRVVLPDAGAAAGDLTRAFADADLVTVVNAPVGRDNRDVMFDLAVTLTVGGFQPGESRTVGQTTVVTWHRVP